MKIILTNIFKYFLIIFFEFFEYFFNIKKSRVLARDLKVFLYFNHNL